MKVILSGKSSLVIINSTPSCLSRDGKEVGGVHRLKKSLENVSIIEMY